MKQMLAFVLFLFTGTMLCAQLSIGPCASATITFRDWKTESLGQIEFDPAVDYRFAIPIVYALSSRFELRGEAAYARRALGEGDLTDQNGNPVSKAKAHLSYQYWEGSLLGVVRPLPRMRSLYLLGGATVARLTDASILHVKGESLETLGLEKKVQNDFNIFNRTNWMGDIGLGSSMQIGPKGTLFVEMRLQKSLSDITKSTLVSAKQTTVLLSAGYLYPLTKAKS